MTIELIYKLNCSNNIGIMYKKREIKVLIKK